MAEDTLNRDIKLSNSEKDKEIQASAAATLYQSWPLPPNMSDLKSFAIGSFTFRDVILVVGCELIPIAFMLVFTGMFLPQIAAVIIGALIGAVPAFLSIRHIFTGDLPIEEKIKIQLADRGNTNLLNWDKTFRDGKYVETSTQSFVPQLEFTDENYVLLPGENGGFSVIEVTADDMSQSKITDILGTVNSFKRLLNSLVRDNECVPIQIMMKSVPKNLSAYIDSALQRQAEITMKNKPVAAARAGDYASLLEELDSEEAYYYKYYIVVTYREDAENVGNSTMNSTSVRRMRLREKGANPLLKKAQMAKNTDFEIGEDRRKKLKELQRDSEFGRKRTREFLKRRVHMVQVMISDLGSTHTEVKASVLTRDELAKLIFQCYNSTDKNTIDKVLSQALDEKPTLVSVNMYNDYPELFKYRREKEKDELDIQKAGGFTSKFK